MFQVQPMSQGVWLLSAQQLMGLLLVCRRLVLLLVGCARVCRTVHMWGMWPDSSSGVAEGV